MLLLAAAKAGDTGWVLVLLDADDDCPVTLALDIGGLIQQRKQAIEPDCGTVEW